MMANHTRTRVLLDKAYGLLIDIYECQEEHVEDPNNECPFCMGELVDHDDLELMDFIKTHLETTTE